MQETTDDHANGIRDAHKEIISSRMCFELIIKMNMPFMAFANSLQFVIHNNITNSSPDIKMNQ